MKKDMGHVISEIDYSENTLVCVCGWKGTAYGFKEYQEHRKTAPAESVVVPRPRGKFNNHAVNPRKSKIAA